MNLNYFVWMLVGFLSTAGFTLSINQITVNRALTARIDLLESRLRATERMAFSVSSGLQVEVIKRQNEVARVDEAQARGFNGVAQMIRLAEDPREDKIRYWQAQSLFLAAKVEAEAGRTMNAQSLALAGMAIATNGSNVGCRNAEPTNIRITEVGAVPVLVKLLENSMYRIEPIPQTLPNLAEIRVTPLAVLPGC